MANISNFTVDLGISVDSAAASLRIMGSTSSLNASRQIEVDDKVTTNTEKPIDLLPVTSEVDIAAHLDITQDANGLNQTPVGTEPIAWSNEPTEANIKNPKDISETIVAAFEKLRATLENGPIDNLSKPLTQKDYPDEKKGFWESEKKYAKRKNYREKTLKRYREKKSTPRISEDGTWGIDKADNIFKRDGDKSNSPYLYFVHYDS